MIPNRIHPASPSSHLPRSLPVPFQRSKPAPLPASLPQGVRARSTLSRLVIASLALSCLPISSTSNRTGLPPPIWCDALSIKGN